MSQQTESKKLTTLHTLNLILSLVILGLVIFNFFSQKKLNNEHRRQVDLLTKTTEALNTDLQDFKDQIEKTSISDVVVKFKIPQPKSEWGYCWLEEECNALATETTIPVKQFLELLAAQYKYIPENKDFKITPAQLIK